MKASAQTFDCISTRHVPPRYLRVTRRSVAVLEVGVGPNTPVVTRYPASCVRPETIAPFFHGPIATCALFMDALRCAWICTRTQTHMCTLLRAIMLSSLTYYSNVCFLCLISFQLFRKRSCNCWRQLHVFEGQPGQVPRDVCVTCHALVTRRQRGPVPPRPRSPSFFSQKAGGLAGRHP